MNLKTHSYQIAVIGGGAAGFFGAIACAQNHPHAQIVILEKTRQLLSKVRISGGGRCNVTHACYDPSLLIQHYPRGYKALLGPFTKFQPKDTIAWFENREVQLKTEEDGRVFPVSDNSDTIISCLKNEAEKLGIVIQTEADVTAIEKKENGRFFLQLQKNEEIECDRLLITTGSSPKMHAILQTLGHAIAAPVPSLFTFTISDPRLEGLSGMTLSNVHLRLVETKLEQRGPLLITHWGLSGPAVLKLSAWGAKELYHLHYQTTLEINWLPDYNEDQLRSFLQKLKASAPNHCVGTQAFGPIPKNLWKKLCCAAGIDEGRLFAHLSNLELQKLLDQLFHSRFNVAGKSLYKEEFVTCGGVDLKQVNFQKMESRVCPGLYFAGEVLDIDGITGGFNFQNAWTTSWLAAQGITSSFET